MSILQESIQRAIDGIDATEEQARDVMTAIMSGMATDAQIGGLLVALRMKGESVAEITGFVRVMRSYATRVPCQREDVVDTCGTGGDGLHTFNISTATAFVAAAAGAAVAKHGNRSVSSRCGSADVLEAVGACITLSPEQVGRCIDELGVGFLFAPALHPAMKYAIGPRRELGVRTVFNILGPLTNPAGARRQLLGVFSRELTEMLAGVLAQLQADRALVVHGHDGMDEITLCDATTLAEVRDGEVSSREVTPEELGLERCSPEDLLGGNAADNAALMRSVLRGDDSPRTDVVIVNAAAALVAAGIAEDLPAGVAQARETIGSGAAAAKLDEFIALTNDLTASA